MKPERMDIVAHKGNYDTSLYMRRCSSYDAIVAVRDAVQDAKCIRDTGCCDASFSIYNSEIQPNRYGGREMNMNIENLYVYGGKDLLFPSGVVKTGPL